MEPLTEHYRRWYDRKAELATAINTLLVFPADIQNVLGDGVSLLAERQFHADRLVKNIRSLGRDTVLALHKASQRKRKYDDNPGVHKAMSYLILLSAADRDFFANQIMELTDCIVAYLQECHSFKAQPAIYEIETLTQLYVEEGKAATEQFLKKFRENFMQKVRNQELSEAFRDDSEGTRIKFTDS